MARCSICDRQSDGLSEYNPMEQFHAVRFYVSGPEILCSDCYSEVNDTLADFIEEEDPEDDKKWSAVDKQRIFEKIERRYNGRNSKKVYVEEIGDD